MKIRNLIKRLEKYEEKHGNVDVMMYVEDGPWEISTTAFEKVNEGDYPEGYGMPAGFKFVSLQN